MPLTPPSRQKPLLHCWVREEGLLVRKELYALEGAGTLGQTKENHIFSLGICKVTAEAASRAKGSRSLVRDRSGGGVPAPAAPHQGSPSLLTRALPAVCYQLWLPAAFGRTWRRKMGWRGGVLPVGAARVAEAWGLFKAPQGSIPGEAAAGI